MFAVVEQQVRQSPKDQHGDDNRRSTYIENILTKGNLRWKKEIFDAMITTLLPYVQAHLNGTRY